MTERRVAGAVLAGRRLLAKRPVLAVAVMFLGAVVATLAHVRGLSIPSRDRSSVAERRAVHGGRG